MRRVQLGVIVCVAAVMVLLWPAGPRAAAEVCNVKVVTDANPDYSDIGSMLHSITSNCKTDKEKVWAIFYWNHIARRQTSPIMLHGLALADPIRQFNDYGYTMCSTISGNNMAIFRALGLKSRYWDISLHTVMDVEIDGKYAMIDSSLSAIYTLCDGKTWADVTEIGQEGACEASGGKVEPGHIAKYHCLNSTSANGFLTGADTLRSTAEEYRCFNPQGLKYRYYYNDWDLGHRYSLNLRDNEVYTRHYRRMDTDTPGAVSSTKGKKDHKADPAYYVPNTDLQTGEQFDPESVNPRYRLRGNGFWTFRPQLTADHYRKFVHSESNIAPATTVGLTGAGGKAAEVVFRVNAANVITSQKITTVTAGIVAIEVSTNNGLTWSKVEPSPAAGNVPGRTTYDLISEVNGAYEVLIRAKLSPEAVLQDIEVKTITQVNTKTQPKLRLGRNMVYVGAGSQTQSVVLWPDLRGEAWKPYVVDSKNVATFKDEKTGKPTHPGYLAVMFAEKEGQDAYVTFKIDVPADLTGLTYGGRFRTRAKESHVDMMHSFDEGKTWTTLYSLKETPSPWDVIRYEKANEIPKGVRSVLIKYLWNARSAGPDACGLFAVRMEANYAPADTQAKPIEVAFTWKEVQKDRKTIERSHVQLVEKLPFTYPINVGGEDHPIMEALKVNLKGATAILHPDPIPLGYSDGKDVGGEKFRDRWETVGKVLSVGKPYTATEVSMTNWNAGDPDGKKLTDGVVGSTYNGGVGYSYGVVYNPKMKPEVTVDLGEVQKCGAFRIQVGGWEGWDALKGEIKDKVEVLTSTDGKEFTSRGFVNFDLRWKDIPANYCWPDEETMVGYNAALILDQQVDARHVKFRITPARLLGITEVQVLDKITYEPFDLKIALPDGQDRSDITKYPLRHDPSQPYQRVKKMMTPEGGKVVGEIK